jgi:hypothetical protein
MEASFNGMTLMCFFPDSDDNTTSDAAEAVGQLSLDENSEVRRLSLEATSGPHF